MLSPLKPRLAITTGDPAGVGPELALQCAQQPSIRDLCVPVIFGDRQVLTAVADRIGTDINDFEQLSIKEIDRLDNIDAGAILDFENPLRELTAGITNRDTGAASFQYVDSAIGAAMRGTIDGIVTGPIQKEAWHAADIQFPGHTELLADRTETDRYRMMLTSSEISCALVTIHIGLSEVPNAISTDGILETIELAHEALSRRDGRPARVSVCGLNPHAGESGLFGQQEEERIIVPAIAAARARGISIRGPLPADTAFVPAIRRDTDVYICMYHDQGLIPLKALAFDDAVNVTLGLPIVRTSVDHGTALDIAWQGIASRSSMVCAIEMAAQLARDH